MWCVALDEVADSALIPFVVADALGLSPVRESAARTLAAFIGTRRVLLILDNCEHLIRGAGEFVSFLLTECPRVDVLMTSRQAVGHTAETTCAIPPLSLDAPRTADSDAVALFLSRARRVAPDFLPDDVEKEVIQRLCEELDGLPLAIELAAARTTVASVRELQLLLEQPLEVLSGGATDAPARHRGLSASLSWSYSLCTDAERTAWARLAMFDGRFTRTAAEALLVGRADDLGVLDLLQSLAEKAVLEAVSDEGIIEFRMLTTTRHFGRSQLSEADRDVARATLFDYALRFCSTAASASLTPAQGEWARRARSEISTIRQAIELGLASASGREQLHVLLDLAFRVIWWANGWGVEVAYWQSRLLAAEVDASVVRARALAAMGVAAASLPAVTGDRFFEDARAIVRSGGFTGITTGIDLNEALAKLLAGKFDDALSLGEAGIAATTGLAVTATHLDFLQVTADAADALGHTDRAVELADRILAIVRPLGETWYRSLALRIKAVSAWRRGRPEQALSLARDALLVSDERDGRASFAATVQAVGLILTALQDDERAAALFGAVEAGAVSLSDARALFANTGEIQRAHDQVYDRLGERRYRLALEIGKNASPRSIRDLALGTAALSDVVTVGTTSATERGPLTPREKEVARLIGTGATSRAIGAELFISTRTVEGHVSRILAKLGLATRSQLAAWVTLEISDDL